MTRHPTKSHESEKIIIGKSHLKETSEKLLTQFFWNLAFPFISFMSNHAGSNLLTSCMSMAWSASWVLSAVLSTDSPLHFTHHIRSEGQKSVPGPTSPLYIPAALILGGLPRVCPSSLSPLSSTSKPLLIPPIHTHTHTTTFPPYPPPAQRNSLALDNVSFLHRPRLIA